ncbi:MAG: hypothetical protein H7328_03075 [Bdellovibrio sp.]|nr:hypothetical protein [Bdellovibrio sp.]
MSQQKIDISPPGDSKLKPRASVAPEKRSDMNNRTLPVQPSKPDVQDEPDMPNKLYEEQLPPEHQLT